MLDTSKDYWVDDDGCLAYGRSDDYETIAVFVTKDKDHMRVIAAAMTMFRALRTAGETLDWLDFFGHMPKTSPAIAAVHDALVAAGGK